MAATTTLVHGMYRLAPISPEPPRAPPPGTMYRLPSLHVERAPPTPGRSISEKAAFLAERPPEELGSLEARQTTLLAKLEALHARMTSMLDSLRTSRPPERPVSSTKTPTESNLSRNVVINVSPDFVPHSLLGLRRTLNMRIDCHEHSSIERSSPAAREFSKRLSDSNPANPDFVATLIWKNVGASAELVVSSFPSVVRGEANVLRYAVSALPCELSYKDGPNALEIDSSLDLCHRLQSHRTAKDRQALLKAMAKRFGNARSGPVTIADLAAWSVLKQLKDAPDLEEFEGLMQKCEDFSK